MVHWSSIRELYHLYQPEIRRYGVCLFGIFIGTIEGRWPLACCCFAALVIIYSYERWGQPWAERGRKVLKGRSTDKTEPPTP